MVLSSSVLEMLGWLLDQQDDLKVSPIKLEALRVLALLSLGGRLFSPNSDLSLATG